MRVFSDSNLDNINIRDSKAHEQSQYDNEDMIAYVSVTGFLTMTVLLLVVVSI